MTRSAPDSPFAPGPMVLTAMILLAAFSRLLPLPPNFAPIEAIALFGGAYFARRGLDSDLAPLYAQALVGSVSMTAQWWLDTREPKKEVVAAHLVNLVWNGLTHLEADPHLQDE